MNAQPVSWLPLLRSPSDLQLGVVWTIQFKVSFPSTKHAPSPASSSLYAGITVLFQIPGSEPSLRELSVMMEMWSFTVATSHRTLLSTCSLANMTEGLHCKRYPIEMNLKLNNDMWLVCAAWDNTVLNLTLFIGSQSPHLHCHESFLIVSLKYLSFIPFYPSPLLHYLPPREIQVPLTSTSAQLCLTKPTQHTRILRAFPPQEFKTVSSC